MIKSSLQNADLRQTKEGSLPSEPNFRVISDAVYSRRELFDLVWELPMTTLANEIRTSTTTIRQTCTKCHIPVPNRGHWSKILVGKPTKSLQLPDRPPGMSNALLLGGRKQPSKFALDTVPIAPTYSITIDALRENVSQQLGTVRIQRPDS